MYTRLNTVQIVYATRVDATVAHGSAQALQVRQMINALRQESDALMVDLSYQALMESEEYRYGILRRLGKMNRTSALHYAQLHLGLAAYMKHTEYLNLSYGHHCLG